ncbi:membrane protein [Klebsiella pneumoniae]|uniref:Membrane protein n=1 Tax=Klebsiella pneumoniae TaxID=573 RepID=A0A3S4IQ07_KLEPN|nr:membrane protein [Klebsiella pneumoniae]
MAWIPAQDVGGDDRQRSDELRIRASNLALSGLSGLQPFADKLAPSLGELWRTTQPGGKINMLALDIPLQATEKTRFSGAVERSGVEAVETPAGGRALLRQSEWQR